MNQLEEIGWRIIFTVAIATGVTMFVSFAALFIRLAVGAWAQ